MFRRDLLKGLGAGGALALAAAQSLSARAATALPVTQVGALDLNQLPVIDVHVHQPADMTDGAENSIWNDDFTNALLPPSAQAPGDPLKTRVLEQFRQHFDRMPREIGMRNYVARVYGVEPTAAGFNSIVAAHVGKDYSAYYRSVMDREKVPAILLQSNDQVPVRPKSLVPNDRFEWSFNIGPLLQPSWAKEKGIRDIGRFEETLLDIFDQAAKNGARGIKIPIAYYRPIAVDMTVERATADRDLKAMLAAPAAAMTRGHADAPIYSDPALTRALRSYQDYLLKRLYVKAGQVGLRIIIHSAVALHPALREDFNDPTGLYFVFQDPDVRRADTQFVIIHTGYPHHHLVAAFLSQFPNVYADLSFYANFPGVLEETLRVFLALAPSEKVMHGSDWSTPETLGYCAYNVRQVLAKILNDYRSSYGWSEKDCETMARNVLSENARRVYNIKL
ncbi:MAG: amidohydrolase family protein [Gammaproteobacteria bacterium]